MDCVAFIVFLDEKRSLARLQLLKVWPRRSASSQTVLDQMSVMNMAPVDETACRLSICALRIS